MRPSPARLLTVPLFAVVLALAACSSSEPASTASSTGPAQCDPEHLATLTDGVLTVGASDPYAPWYIGEHDSGKGYESAVVYAVADQLGYPRDKVKWVNVTFEQMISPAIKPFDIAAYQVSITEARAKAVDFSSPYRRSLQGVLVAKEGTYSQADSLADLDGARIGVTAGQTSTTIAEAAWGPDANLVPFSAVGDGMQALSAGTIDAMVMDADQGVAAAGQYFPDTKVIGTLPPDGEPGRTAFVLDRDSALTACVSKAVDGLDADGTLKKLQTEWLKSDDLPKLR